MYRINWIVLLALVLTPLLASPAAAGEVSQTGKTDLTLTAEASGVVLDLSLPSYRIESIIHEGVTYQQVAIDGQGWWPAGQPGAPSLPERGLMLAVPPTGEVTVQMLETQPQGLDGFFRLAPKPTGVLVEDEAAEQVVEQWLVDPTAYSLDSWTPASQAEITEEGWFRGYRFVRLSLRPFQFNPASGELQAAPAMRVRVSFSEPAPAAPAPADPLFASIFQATFENYEQAAGWQTRPEQQPMPAEAAQRLLTTDPQVKVTVNSDGLYRVTYADLQSAGVLPSVLNSLNPRTFRLLDAGQEQHIHVVGEGDNVFNSTDSIVFYGQRNTQPHSDDNNVYWLTWGGANGLRMAVQNAAPSGAALATTLLTTAHAEENLEYKQQRPFVDWLQPVLYDQWYGGQVITSKVVTFPGLKVNTASTVAPVLSVWMAGDKQAPGNYTVRFTLNGSPFQSRSWTSTRVLEGTVNLPAGALVNGDNNVEVRPINASGASGYDYTVWLDWLRLTYPYNGQYLSGATFNNPASGLWRYQISDVPAAAPWVLNVGAPSQPKLLSNVAASGSGPYTLTWQQTTSAADRFLVVPETEVRQPAAVAVWQGST
ncbi:MAG TPA: C25 family peptidase propeptide domain-containing protein, partial [Anaerolineae bacterium]|nr:C25 family peptidase propeptide domain-containing protein [Anaerolineae bacterium]